MSGHWLSRLVCLVTGHAERLWQIDAQGIGWLCPVCHHVQRSRVLRRRVA